MKLRFIILLICYSTVSFSQKSKEPALKDWNNHDFSYTFSYKNGGGKKDIAKLKRVFIADFAVNQVITAVGKQTGSTNFAKMTVGLGGIDVKAYQTMVAELYQLTIQQLKDAGYEVLADEEVASNKFLMEEKNSESFFVGRVGEELATYKELGNEVVSIRPVGKFAVRNTKTTAGIWYNKFCKAINAQAVTINLNVTFMAFDGSRLGGAKIEGKPLIDAYAVLMWSNANGGMWVFPGGHMYGNNTWAKSGITETGSSSTVFGSAKSTYVVEASQADYLAEIQGMLKGVSKTFVQKMINEGK